ncbi:hypothetical protein SY83_10445 [Paenibacillus swuensis]|uniref:N-acetyltransferase domain-containing protein n=1 Tax=Paenibacillus swuensis TaxID=1178515 RepID=A0A172THX6_9BACL|nr:GNAT family N-acetyltransferase [Paenibacillus swuensis]ANE46620.1 hypothetical protein SY83_10445 [Paenibacillus swuensis]
MLTLQEQTDVKKLQDICESADGVQLKLNWDMLRNREAGVKNDFLLYEGDLLIGFAALYGFGSMVEICGMVHPDARRRGIFTKLMAEAMDEVRIRKFNKVLLNAPSDSNSAKGFLNQLDCHFAHSEHQMKWHEFTNMVPPRAELYPIVAQSVLLRPSEPEDLELEVQLDVRCFNFPESDAREYTERLKCEGQGRMYIIEQNQKAVGKMRVISEDGEAWIYGFAVLPDVQGRGIGRSALKQIVQQERANGSDVYLEVEATNRNALKLYEDCGFRSYHSQDYYSYK